jgi:uncharacterized damage-inducible protein DinB
MIQEDHMATQSMVTPKQQFLSSYDQEHATTMKVLRAYPADKLDLRPHKMCKDARELAWMFVIEQGFMEKGATVGFDWSTPPAPFPKPPESWETQLSIFDEGQKRVAAAVNALNDQQLFDTIKFFTGPKEIGDMPKIQFLWMILCDQIHHRGQFSIYLRMADGKVPSIYGPTADEPWF